MSMRVMMALVAGLALGGCVTTAANTPSGSPEVTVKATPDRAKAALMNVVLNKGLRVKSDTGYSLVVEQATRSTAGQVLSAGAAVAPVERVSFALAPVAGGTRIVADSAYVTKPGTAFEENTPNSAWKVYGPAELQALLNETALTAGRS